jgi:hypothetical protein
MVVRSVSVMKRYNFRDLPVCNHFARYFVIVDPRLDPHSKECFNVLSVISISSWILDRAQPYSQVTSSRVEDSIRNCPISFSHREIVSFQGKNLTWIIFKSRPLLINILKIFKISTMTYIVV